MPSRLRFALPLLLSLVALAAQAPAQGALLARLVPPGQGPAAAPASGGPSVLSGPFQTQEVFRSHPAIYAGGSRLVLLVNSFLYPQVRNELAVHVELLEREGWGVAVVTASGGRDTDLRAFLQARYQADRIQGAFLIGDLPVAWFEMDDDFFLGRAVFPCDFYFMDLDGTWIDQDQDGLWDGHAASTAGDRRPEIFVGRLVAGPFADAFTSEADWVRGYLSKAAEWRRTRFDLPDRALSFQDDLWAHLDTGQQHAFSQVLAVTDPAQTSAAGYLAELARSHRSVVLCAASDSQEHRFSVPGGGPSRVQAAEILGSQGFFPFCNLFAAHAGNFTVPRYIGGAYVLARRGAIAAVASTKIGAMTEWDDFYRALGRGATVGGAFKEWLAGRHPYDREQMRWYYGLTLLGDPTLVARPRTLAPRLPTLSATGGTVVLDLNCGPTHAGQTYLMLATASGTNPGEVLPGFRLPLNLDGITTAFLEMLNRPVFQRSFGTLDAQGTAFPWLVWTRPLDPGLHGLQLHFSALLMDPATLAPLGAVGPAPFGLAREAVLVEDFTTTTFLDRERSGALWGGGKLVPGLIGGSGLLGDFDPAVGSIAVGSAARRIHVFRTDDTLIPGGRTLDGKDFRVVDGRYEFASFVLPADVTVRFEGAYPARILVRGQVAIHGTLDLSGLSPTVVAEPNQIPGQPGAPGGRPGAGGGQGGDGGNEPGQGVPRGMDGQDLLMPPRHPRSGWQVGTGGRGSLEHPPGLNPAAITHDYYDLLSIQLSAPGGGGGSYTAGGIGSIVMVSPPTWSLRVPAPQPVHGSPVNPSERIPFLPVLLVPQMIDQLVLGGAGGGGAGITCYGSVQSRPIDWSFGNGGGGGGGGAALRVGSDLQVSPTGRILTAGGAGGGAGGAAGLAPGGGGGGGTILLQTGGTPSLLGSLDLRGGPALAGGDPYATATLTSAAGGDGLLRVEALPAPGLVGLGSVLPAPTADNVGPLTDRDPVTGAMSLWHRPPLDRPWFTRFVIEATANGVPVTFSDQSNPPGPRQPVSGFYLQGARLDGQDRVVPGSETGWFSRSAGLMADQAQAEPALRINAVRWVILLDPSTLAPPATLEVRRVTLFHAY